MVPRRRRDATERWRRRDATERWRRRDLTSAQTLPLGVRHQNVALLMALIAGAARPARRRWLLINNSGWQFRSGINDVVAANFRPKLRNASRAAPKSPSRRETTAGSAAFDGIIGAATPPRRRRDAAATTPHTPR